MAEGCECGDGGFELRFESGGLGAKREDAGMVGLMVRDYGFELAGGIGVWRERRGKFTLIKSFSQLVVRGN